MMKVIAGEVGEPGARLHLMKDASGFEFWQTTYGDYRRCLKAHDRGEIGFKSNGKALLFEGKLVRPAGGE